MAPAPMMMPMAHLPNTATGHVQPQVPAMQMPAPSLPTTPQDPVSKELLSYLNKRRTDLPPDVQQKVQSIARKERANVSKDLQDAVKQLDAAKEAYEEALLARSQHIRTWKTFLAEAVKNWSEYGTMFAQHEQTLQERIAAAKDQFSEAKEVLEQSKTQAGKLGVEEISDEEDLPTETESSAQQITASIQTLSTSLQQLSKEAEAIKIEEHTAKRPRTEGPTVPEAPMEDGSKPFG